MELRIRLEDIIPEKDVKELKEYVTNYITKNFNTSNLTSPKPDSLEKKWELTKQRINKAKEPPIARSNFNAYKAT